MRSERFPYDNFPTKPRMQAAPSELVSCAEWLYDEGHMDVLTLLHFIEKPNNYPELLDLWDNEQSVQGELQDERRAIL